MIRKLTLFSVCAFEIALIFFAGIQSVSSNTFEPFENGVGILCKTIESKDNKEPLFFLFAEDRQSVSRLRFEKNQGNPRILKKTTWAGEDQDEWVSDVLHLSRGWRLESA